MKTWTEKERLEFIARASCRAQIKIRASILTPYDTFCLLETIAFVATKSATFLQANESQILELLG